MKVLFISAHMPDGLESGSNRLRKLKKGIEALGGEVSWNLPSGNRRRDCFRFVTAVVRWLRYNPDGVCLVSLPPPWLVFPAAVLALLRGRRIWLDFRDPILNQKTSPRPWYFRVVMGVLQRIAVRFSGGAIYASSRIMSVMGLIPKSFAVVYAGLEPSELARVNKIQVQSHPDGRVKFVYGGTFYSGRSPLVLLDALKLLQEKGISPSPVFYLYSCFNDKEEERLFRKRIVDAGLAETVLIRALLKRDEFLAELKSADCNILFTHQAGSEYAIPGKIFDYIMAGKPILAVSRDPELLDFSQRFGLKVSFVPPGAAEELAAAILNVTPATHGQAASFDKNELFCESQAKKFLDLVYGV